MQAGGQPEHVLKILTGRLAASATPLVAGEDLYIGRGLRNDVVVRDRAVGETRLRLRLNGEDEVADVDVMAGLARLLGRDCQESTQVTLPPFTPLWMGQVALAHGDPADAGGWARCASLMEHEPPASPGGAAERWDGVKGWAAALTREKWVRRWGSIATASLLICLGLLQIGMAYGFRPAATPSRQLQSILSDSVYSGLELRHGSRSDEFIIAGFLPSESMRARLQNDVAALDADIVMEVQTGGSLVRAVEDIFRLNDVAADVTYAGARRVRVEGAVATADQIERLRTIAESDVPGLAAIEIDFTEPEPPEDTADADPSKRVATVVGGARGYVVTEDGARYFVGATLPTGHRIVEISDGEVLVERDGERTAYQF